MIRDGLRVLLARDRAVEDWLRKDVAAAYDALKVNPSRAVAVGAVKAGRAGAREGIEEGLDEGLTQHAVFYAPEAIDQLEELFLFIAERRSPAVANRYPSAVVETCKGLALFPLRGVSREDIRLGLRVTHHKERTVIAYAVDEDSRTVSILGVLYGGQDIKGALTEDGDA